MSTLQVDNIKCGGCAGHITRKIEAIEGVTDLSIDIPTGTVSFGAADQSVEDKVISELKRLGYPLTGTGGVIDNAKSFVSCMIGRVEGKLES